MHSLAKTILKYVGSRKWFLGVRAEESLFFYSCKRKGIERYVRKWHGVSFAETLLIPSVNGYPIRVFNLRQAKIFHARSRALVTRNPSILSSYLKKNQETWHSIKSLNKKLIQAADDENRASCIKLMRQAISAYEKASAQSFIIFSLGLELSKTPDPTRALQVILKKHDTWRNSVVFNEEELGKALFTGLKFIRSSRVSEIGPADMLKYLTSSEIVAWLEKEMTAKEVAKLVGQRKRDGYVYVDLRRAKDMVIGQAASIRALKKRFARLTSPEPDRAGLKGQVAFRSTGTIRGQVVVIKDKSHLAAKADKLKGKILVAIQTTPHFISVLKQVKAIITDEGGLTCHASIVAREMKIPCLVGTKNATYCLKDGDRVELDLTHGTVVKIKA
jgi:phosphohistidine swiveling domain-containing protein